MRTKTTLTAMAIVIAMTFFACKGEQGQPGTPGTNGAANVYSSSITVQQSQWTNVSGTDNYYDEITYTAIGTAGSDLVEVYFLSPDLINSSDNGWSPLPSGGYYYNVYNGGVELEYYGSGSSIPASSITFNIVVIPPPALAKMKQQKIDLNDYNQVNAYMKLNSK